MSKKKLLLNLKRMIIILVIGLLIHINILSVEAKELYVEYELKENDTLYKIAQTYGYNLQKLQQINSNTDATNLKVGQLINLPTKLYRIDTDITLEELAKRFETTVDTIKKTNSLLSDKIYKGDFIKISQGYDIKKKYENKYENKYKEDDTDLDNPFEVFMFKTKNDYEGLYNSYNAERTWSPNGTTVRGHEGIDILADYGTPIYAVASGTIARFGWNQYGGWRINIKLDNYEFYTYYAHMSSYAKGMYLGKHVVKGELIGYVGDTGYGPEGTSGKFVPHLHFGLYDKNMNSLSPYEYLVDLEKRYFRKD